MINKNLAHLEVQASSMHDLLEHMLTSSAFFRQASLMDREPDWQMHVWKW